MNVRILAQRKAMVARKPEYYTCHIAHNRKEELGIVHFSLYTGFTWTRLGRSGCQDCHALVRELINRQLPADKQLPSR